MGRDRGPGAHPMSLCPEGPCAACCAGLAPPTCLSDFALDAKPRSDTTRSAQPSLLGVELEALGSRPSSCPAMCLLTSPATQAVSSLRRMSVAEAVFAAPRGGYTYDLCTFLCACCISVRYLIGKQTQKVKQFMQTVFHQTPLSALLFSGSYSCTAASHRPQVRAVARKTVPAFVCLMHGPRAEPRAVQEPGVPVPAWPPTCPTCSSAVRV